MNTVEQLNLGYSDAQNYLQRANKDLFSRIFVKNSYLNDLLKPTVYYLIGEKGTGKTAYATYLSNSEYNNNKGILKFIGSTDYEKFYELKKRGKIDFSGYVDIWKAILLLILAKNIAESDQLLGPFRRNKLNSVLDAIDEYYYSAFSPEIINALKVVDSSSSFAKIVSKHLGAGGDLKSTREFTEQHLQMNLYYVVQRFSECFETIKLSKNITLFVDGIDVRPSQIPYCDYLECIRGLESACWSLNTELFSQIRDSSGRFKIVLLLRPDIFNSLNLQNATNRLADNSVFLEWRTTYREYEHSMLYKMANKLLAYNQPEFKKIDCWKLYFNWELATTSSDREYDTAFMTFLRISLSRPRDIQYIMTILQTIMKRRGLGGSYTFDEKVFLSDEFQNAYSEYFLGSLKDQLTFYYTEDDYTFFTKFFDYFSKASFSYKQYLKVYQDYTDYILMNAKEIPEFMDDPKDFLQMLYDSNVIVALERIGKRTLFHFSYREKSPTCISPDVPYSERVSYRFHYGLYKKGKFGRF